MTENVAVFVERHGLFKLYERLIIGKCGNPGHVQDVFLPMLEKESLWGTGIENRDQEGEKDMNYVVQNKYGDYDIVVNVHDLLIYCSGKNMNAYSVFVQVPWPFENTESKLLALEGLMKRLAAINKEDQDAG